MRLILCLDDHLVMLTRSLKALKNWVTWILGKSDAFHRRDYVELD